MRLQNTLNNYKVITFLTQDCNYKVITARCFVYTLCLLFLLFIHLPVRAFELLTPVREGQLVYGRLAPDERLYVDSQLLHNGKQSDGDQTPVNGDSQLLHNGKQSDRYQIPVNEDGLFVLGIPQDAAQHLTVFLENKQGIVPKHIAVDRVHWKEDIVNGLPAGKVSPDTKAQKRIVDEALLLQKARQSSDGAFFPETWILPVAQYTRISSPFGSRRVLNGTKKAGHSGTDFAAPTGTAVVAPTDGRVKVVHPDMFYTGKTILIDHGQGVFSSYSHLSEINVTENQVVKQGDVIGAVGMTGRSTGPHLHFAVTWFGVRVNPEFLFEDALKK